jgi:DNA-binding CsgD family transcriptional regulator
MASDVLNRPLQQILDDRSLGPVPSLKCSERKTDKVPTGEGPYMAIDRTNVFQKVLMTKTCARCGRGFGALGREYTCPTCKEPAASQRESTRSLSFREKQIVHLIQQAKSNKEIAYELCLTTGTVKEYIYHIFRKLNVSNRTELALWGREFQRELEVASVAS